MSNETFFYPPKMGKIMLLGMEEVMGINRVDACFVFLRLKIPFKILRK